MKHPDGHTTVLANLLQRLGNGDGDACEQLIVHSLERLRRLARTMLRENPAVGRWYQTDDVLQSALVRLNRALRTITPESPRRYIGLAAMQIRRELIDLHRALFGAEGLGANFVSDVAAGTVDSRPRAFDVPAHETGPNEIGIADMVRFHTAVDSLPEEEQEVFQLVFYADMSQDEIAQQLGVSTKTVKRRWREARLRLHQILCGEGNA